MNTCLVSKEVEFDAAHRVPLHASKCKNLHGHRYKVRATVKGPIIESPTPDQGMVLDFGELKRLMMVNIHDVYDHSSIFYVNDDLMRHTVATLVAHDPMQKVHFVSFVPTAENFAKEFHVRMRHLLPIGMELVEVTVWETPTSQATYRGD